MHAMLIKGNLNIIIISSSLISTGGSGPNAVKDYERVFDKGFCEPVDEQRKEHRVLSGAQQGHVGIRTFNFRIGFDDIPVLDTTSGAQIL